MLSLLHYTTPLCYNTVRVFLFYFYFLLLTLILLALITATSTIRFIIIERVVITLHLYSAYRPMYIIYTNTHGICVLLNPSKPLR